MLRRVSTRSSPASPPTGSSRGELDRVRTRLVSVLLREMDAVLVAHARAGHVRAAARRAELINELPRPARRRHRGRRCGPPRRHCARTAAPCSSSSPAAHDETRRCHSVVPPLTAPAPAAQAQPSAERTLANGLRVIAVRKPGVPLVEMRLRVPFLSAAPSHPARAALLSDAVLTGTARARPGRSGRGRAGARRRAVASASTPTGCSSPATSLATNLRGCWRSSADVLDDGHAIPPTRSRTERDRLVDRLDDRAVASRRLAAEALRAPDVRRPPVRARAARRSRGRRRDAARSCAPLHARAGCARPARRWCSSATSSPARALDAGRAALGGWTRSPQRRRVPPLPPLPSRGRCCSSTGPARCSPRCGWAARAAARDRPRTRRCSWPTSIFGGYFSSRWTENIREDKGYTYGPHSRIEHHVLGSSLVFDAEVATEVTAPALLETLLRARPDRVAAGHRRTRSTQARQYAIGTLALSHGHAGRAGLDAVRARRRRARAGLAGRAPAAAGRGRRRRRERGGRRVPRAGAGSRRSSSATRRPSPRRWPRWPASTADA